MKQAIRKIKAMKTIGLRVTWRTIKQKSEVMKTKNNVQKTILRFAAVVISLVLISFTVSAQDFWKKLITGSGFNEIALAMVDHTSYVNVNSESTFTNFDFTLTDVAEDDLELEPWMTDNSIFSNSVSANTIETDVQLKLEPWMLNEKLFVVSTADDQLELENWMIDKSLWN